MGSFYYVPGPVLSNILNYLDAKDLAAASKTCKRWNQLINSELWVGERGRIRRIQSNNLAILRDRAIKKYKSNLEFVNGEKAIRYF